MSLSSCKIVLFGQLKGLNLVNCAASCIKLRPFSEFAGDNLNEAGCSPSPLASGPVLILMQHKKTYPFSFTARQQANPRKNKPKSEKARKMAAKVALMKMKIHAEGDSGIPEVITQVLLEVFVCSY